MEQLKQVVGIDVASQSLMAAIGTIDRQQQTTIEATAEFANSAAGIQRLLAWIDKHRQAELPFSVVMEATGVYYERVAVTLHEAGLEVSVALPNKIKGFARSQNQKSKTDRIDAGVIACFGLKNALKPWQPASALMIQLKALMREHDAIEEMLTQTRNRLHASEHAHNTPKQIIKRLRQQRDLFQKQLKTIAQDLKKLVESDAEFSESVNILTSIQGVGLQTAVGVLSETNNFAMVETGKQLVSYSGLDPKLRESGTWRGTTMISAAGNSHLRKILYMPALSAIRYNPALRAVYLGLVQRKSVKMIAVAAVMRKLLTLMYTLWKKRELFDPEYHLNKRIVGTVAA